MRYSTAGYTYKSASLAMRIAPCPMSLEVMQHVCQRRTLNMFENMQLA